MFSVDPREARALSSYSSDATPRRSAVITKTSLALIVAAVFVASPVDAASKNRRPGTRRPVPAPELVWYVETVEGEVVDARRQDLAINPASIVKIATSWWALEKLGPDHRFTTRFAARGTIDRSHGLLKGDLIVHGESDPDFQSENAFLVAQALNQLGVRRVTGSVVVDGTFWMGWENGSQGTNPDPVRRATLMASRLRQG